MCVQIIYQLKFCIRFLGYKTKYNVSFGSLRSVFVWCASGVRGRDRVYLVYVVYVVCVSLSVRVDVCSKFVCGYRTRTRITVKSATVPRDYQRARLARGARGAKDTRT